MSKFASVIAYAILNIALPLVQNILSDLDNMYMVKDALFNL
jgi:hypothetical protein